MFPACHVLLIEDNEPLVDVLQSALEDDGARVTAVADAAAALAALEQVRPDVILLDSGLPGLNSYDFVESYLKLPVRHAPIIRMTAMTWKSPPPHPAVAYHLPKPFDLDELENAIEVCLGDRPGS